MAYHAFNEQIMQLQRNTLFPRPKGQRLTPANAVPLMRRGGLVLGAGETHSMMRGSDGLEIGFDG
jgi:hypothetical protein